MTKMRTGVKANFNDWYHPDLTLQEMGERAGVSRQRVQQILMTNGISMRRRHRGRNKGEHRLVVEALSLYENTVMEYPCSGRAFCPLLNIAARADGKFAVHHVGDDLHLVTRLA